MTSIESFLELWRAFSLDADNRPGSLGIDDVAPASGSPALDELRVMELSGRANRVVQYAENFLDTDDPYIAQTLPCWLSCVSDEVICRWTEQFRSTYFARAAAAVLHSRVARLDRSRRTENFDHGTLLSPDAQVRFDELLMRCDYPTRPLFAEAHENYLSLLNAAGGTGSPAATAAATVRRTVIVHGTWASGATWWRDPSGLGAPPAPDSLWAYLDANKVKNLVAAGHEFFWSGGNSDLDRRQGAADFVTWWQTNGSPTLDVISHSHGGNVVMGACLIEPTLKPRRLILLGTPSRFDFVPRAEQTEVQHNVYSEHDLVQVPGSLGGRRGEGRTQSDHVHSMNWHVPFWNDKTRVMTVSHSDLHHPDVWANHKLLNLLA